MSGGAWSKFRGLKIESCIMKSPLETTTANPDRSFEQTKTRRAG